MLSMCAEFTEGWRRTGLPSKAAQLQQQAAPNLNLQQHQPQRKHSAGVRKLLDAGSILAAHQQRYRAEVLEPPVVFTYNDNARDPHYLETTANLQVSKGLYITPNWSSGTVKQKAGCAAGDMHGAQLHHSAVFDAAH
jgi:hypothetical protein